MRFSTLTECRGSQAPEILNMKCLEFRTAEEAGTGQVNGQTLRQFDDW